MPSRKSKTFSAAIDNDQSQLRSGQSKWQTAPKWGGTQRSIILCEFMKPRQINKEAFQRPIRIDQCIVQARCAVIHLFLELIGEDNGG
jgi:hypothetical protein